jgi:cell division protein FtsW
MRAATISLITCVGALVALGMVMLYSSSMFQRGSHLLSLQAIAGMIGVGCCIIAALVDYRWLKRFAVPLYLLTIVLLVLVLIPGIGVWKNGARRWFDLKVVNFQPSELAKLSIIMLLAWYGATFSRYKGTFWKGLVVPGMIAAVGLGLIFVEPDRGTAILMGGMTGVMLLLSGVKLLYLILPAIPVVCFVGWSLYNDPVRLKRIIVWLSPEEYKGDVGYQAWQSMVALGSGGLSGLGLGNGRQKLGFVPEHHTDFIFSIIGEELGLIATLAVVALFLILILSGLTISWKTKDTFGFLLASGITFLIAFQAFINIGVVTNALPNKGLPLPFISYGGSSLVLMLTCIGILISVARHTEEPLQQEEFDAADLPAPHAA